MHTSPSTPQRGKQKKLYEPHSPPKRGLIWVFKKIEIKKGGGRGIGKKGDSVPGGGGEGFTNIAGEKTVCPVRGEEGTRSASRLDIGVKATSRKEHEERG